MTMAVTVNFQYSLVAIEGVPFVPASCVNSLSLDLSRSEEVCPSLTSDIQVRRRDPPL